MAKILSFLGSLVAPKTPRGRVRRATFFVLVLFVLAGSVADARPWNAAAAWVEGATGISAPRFPVVPFRLGLDLQGGTHLVYTADVSELPDGERSEAVESVRDVIERRVNAFGVAEPLIQTNRSGEDWRVIVDLAGVTDVSEAIRLIGETPLLEFKELGEAQPVRELTPEERDLIAEQNRLARQKADQALARASADEDFAALVAELSDDTATKEQGGDLGFLSGADAGDRQTFYALASGREPGTVVPTLVSTPSGHHVLKVEETRDGPTEIQASHILVCWAGAATCTSDRTKEEAYAIATGLIADATPATFADLAREHSDDPGSGPTGGSLGWFGPGIMVAPFEQAAFALPDGGISPEPAESAFGYHIIHKVAERVRPEIRVSRIFAATLTEADLLPPADPWTNTELSGKHLRRSTLQFDATTGAPNVGIEFNDEGRQLFRDISERNVGKQVAIFLDGDLISAPMVNETIHDGSAVIMGNFSIQEARLLVRRLNAGALPVPIRLESQQSIGASLGQESLSQSLVAGLIGFLAVAGFLLLYYRLAGIIAVIALSLYAVMNLALYKLIPVTLTLSGIAGFILSVGMAVDANILIFERLKEELLRGRTLASAIDEGFRRAWLSIRDSNFTTLISCAILFYTSTSLIRGFALTLGVGVLISMFSAITVSRTLLRLVAGWPWLRSPVLYLSGLHRMPAEPAAGEGASRR